MLILYCKAKHTFTSRANEAPSGGKHNQNMLTILEGKTRLLSLDFGGYVLLPPECGTSIFVSMYVVLVNN